MTDRWHVRYEARDFGAANQFLTRWLWRRLPYRWLFQLLGGAYSLVFFLALVALWKAVEREEVPYGNWFLGLFAAAFAIGVIGSAAGRWIWRHGTERLWGLNSKPDTVALDEIGISIEGGMGLTRVPWTMIQEIVEEPNRLYFMYRGVACLYVPTLGFENPRAFEEFRAKVQARFSARNLSSDADHEG